MGGVFVVGCWTLVVVGWLLFARCWWLLVGGRLLSVVCCLLCVVLLFLCLAFGVLVFEVCRLSVVD